jgi:DNA invertase Pin-like site-specific DNA recombinase
MGLTTDSLQQSIDATTSGSRLIFHIFGALAEFERNLIRERTIAGLRAAQARGRVGGRPRKLDAKKQSWRISYMMRRSMRSRRFA